MVWFIVVLFWPLAAVATGAIFVFLSLSEEPIIDEKFFLAVLAVICFFIAAAGGMMFYSGYILGGDESKVVYLILVNYWAVVTPLPSKKI